MISYDKNTAFWVLLYFKHFIGVYEFQLLIYVFEQTVELPEKSRLLFLSDYWTFVDIFITTPNSFFFFASLHGFRDFSSPTRDWTRALGSETAES